MNIRTISLAAFALTLVSNGPAVAQMAKENAMASGSEMKMTAAETKTMKACQKMTHDKMMKSAKCSAMMKSHPDMMMKNDDAMMKK